ncbi:RagB/SusD family nutrient uptake outer membrane protein [Pseudoflavitalea sp. G-6-1-2]|uniref:RagB/SusD family nutrient uptake outer membrane protein n=1 Tax=Pseudoflavitalea sp. G-6-1-2 TaxID=2728841 RepID=UPI001469A60A|nr:RagB/SusD family nutrient uptake outer membrane protein [Pseudoflavitalea sp. G-6-1-2]NML20336.1 RagB/SusD family nutrient uptake outer membrane protein [Pseudoflavitalea sp. G-6-1-2]
MKKNIIIYSLAALSLTMLAACEKTLNVNPINDAEEELAVRTSEDVEAILIGAYSDLGDADVYGGSLFVAGELLAGNRETDWTGTFETYTDIYNKDIKTVNNEVTNIWGNSYRVVSDVNIVLANINLVAPLKKAKVEGEAKFIRACLYFDLVRLFGKAWQDGDPTKNDGVPLVLKPYKTPLDDEDLPSRAPVSAVYEQVIKDLTDAENLLEVPGEGDYFANKIAAQAMLARVYLQKGDYTNAAAAANRAIETNDAEGPFKLMSTYAAAFPINDNRAAIIGNTAEDIFAIQVSNTDGVNDFFTYLSFRGRGDLNMTQLFMDQFEANDDRAKSYDKERTNVFYTLKFNNPFASVHIIRLAEVYLTRAEANFRKGQSLGADPVDDINLIRERAKLDPLDAADLTLDKILRERKLELAFEGFTLPDIKRTMGTTGSFAWNANELVLPIPDRERRVNKNLSQNPGYGN